MTTWPVREVHLAAYYLSNHDKDAASIPCRSVSLIPGNYKSEVGADGSVSRSITKPASLLLEGADPSALHKLGWQPQVALFTDASTGEEHSFNIGGAQTDGSGRVVLPLGP